MGLLYSFNNFYDLKKNNRFINEAEVDGEDQSDPDNQPEDYTDNNNEQVPNDTQPPDDTGEGEGNDQTPPPDGNEEVPEDYTDAANEEQEAPPPQRGQPEQEEEQPVDDIKQQEEELYGDLTPEQLNARHRELKNRFLDLYDVTKSILNRIDCINISEENITPIKYISKTLNDLNDILIDYVNNAYSTKSYTENAVNFNRFLSILKGVEIVFNELNAQDNGNKSNKE